MLELWDNSYAVACGVRFHVIFLTKPSYEKIRFSRPQTIVCMEIVPSAWNRKVEIQNPNLPPFIVSAHYLSHYGGTHRFLGVPAIGVFLLFQFRALVAPLPSDPPPPRRLHHVLLELLLHVLLDSGFEDYILESDPADIFFHEYVLLQQELSSLEVSAQLSIARVADATVLGDSKGNPMCDLGTYFSPSAHEGIQCQVPQLLDDF